ncbi:hypothetical protein GQ42DRAFT_61792 [Ramicandelaber brevisporus]|nr:hypothetical protein GQ42DRAFT_61792 [Ramicandelaber brevisporus]
MTAIILAHVEVNLYPCIVTWQLAFIHVYDGCACCLLMLFITASAQLTNCPIISNRSFVDALSISHHPHSGYGC